jgi:hypothetical protein
MISHNKYLGKPWWDDAEAISQLVFTSGGLQLFRIASSALERRRWWTVLAA